tara:strand:- start:242 stop:412 length:171 start_codon:yes stop_codon:yes gene_type:complete
MTLYDKIITLYPVLTSADFAPPIGTITLQDNSDGKGAYIAKWEHPTLAKPTDEELS